MAEHVNQHLVRRVEQLQQQLTPAVQRGGNHGGAFALMLSLIQQAEALAGKPAKETGAAVAPLRDLLWTPELVGRMGRALQLGQRGEVAMLRAWLESAPSPFAPDRAEAGDPAGDGVPLSQAAVLARSYNMVDEIRASRVAVAA